VRSRAGRQNGGVSVAAFIAGGDYHHDSALASRFHRLAQRILRAALENGTAQRQIDHANVVLSLELNGLLDGRDHHTVVAGAVLIQNAQIQNVRMGRDAFERTEGALLIGRTAVPRDDAGHVRSMAEIVVEHSSNEALPIDNAALR
jgi:hypothetical protein